MPSLEFEFANVLIHMGDTIPPCDCYEYFVQVFFYCLYLQIADP